MKIISKKSLGKQKVYDAINSQTKNFMLNNGVIVHNSGVVDEANFLEVIEDSKKKGSGEVYDAAEEMENAIMNRMTSRFMRDGVIPGLLCMISSPLYPDSYMERKIKQIKEKGEGVMKAFYRSRSTWEAKGARFFPDFYERDEYIEVDLESLQIIKENIRRG